MRWKFAAATAAIGVSVLAVQAWINATHSWTPGAALAIPATPGRLVAAAGLVEPASEARQLDTTMVGRLVALNVAEGDHVGPGQVIAEIENADLKAQLAEAEAILAAKENELTRLMAGARPQEIDQAKAALRQANAAAIEARENYQRQVALGKKKLVSDAAVEQALAGRDTSEAQRELAAAQLSLLTAPPRAEDAAIATANVEAARARIDEINAQIEKSMIRSPIDATVLKIYRRTGETVTNLPPTPIATVGDTSRLRVRADIDQIDVSRVAVGETAWITADAFGGKRFHGSVVRIGSQLGQKNFRTEAPQEKVDTRVLEVLIDLDAGVRLPIGLPVDVIFDSTAKTISNRDSRTDTSVARPGNKQSDSTTYHLVPIQTAITIPPLVETAPPQTERVAVEAKNPTATTPVLRRKAEGAMVQIGSYVSFDLAQAGWVEFTGHHGELVKEAVADIRKADLGKKGVWYRLRFGPFANRAASGLCEQLKSEGSACLVVGSRLD